MAVSVRLGGQEVYGLADTRVLASGCPGQGLAAVHVHQEHHSEAVRRPVQGHLRGGVPSVSSSYYLWHVPKCLWQFRFEHK